MIRRRFGAFRAPASSRQRKRGNRISLPDSLVVFRCGLLEHERPEFYGEHISRREYVHAYSCAIEESRKWTPRIHRARYHERRLLKLNNAVNARLRMRELRRHANAAIPGALQGVDVASVSEPDTGDEQVIARGNIQ
jgi:hypothetical protein